MRALLIAGFIAVPLIELYVVIQVGQVIGVIPTVALLLLESLLGAWLVKREGRRAWAALQEGITSGRMPSAELADAGLVLVGGTLLLTPGFVTDIVGFAFILPLTRPLGRRLLGWFVARQIASGVSRRVGLYVPPTGGGGPGRSGPGSSRPGSSGPGFGATRFGAGQPRQRPEGGAQGRVVPGEVVDDGEERRSG